MHFSRAARVVQQIARSFSLANSKHHCPIYTIHAMFASPLPPLGAVHSPYGGSSSSPATGVNAAFASHDVPRGAADPGTVLMAGKVQEIERRMNLLEQFVVSQRQTLDLLTSLALKPPPRRDAILPHDVPDAHARARTRALHEQEQEAPRPPDAPAGSDPLPEGREEQGAHVSPASVLFLNRSRFAA